jgi:glycosyltransferase involved in cell wall biosynthesis
VNLLVVADAGLFPHPAQPQGGIFFANFLKYLRPGLGRLVVVQPWPRLPRPLLWLPRFAAARKGPAHEWWDGIEVFRPDILFAGARDLWLPARSACRAAGPLCERLHHRYRFDLVLSTSLGPSAHLAQYVARRLSLGCVGWATGSDVHDYPKRSAGNLRFLRHVVRRCGLVLTASDDLRRTLRTRFPWASHVRTFYRGIALGTLRGEADRGSLRRRLGLDPARTYLVMAGAVRARKGAWEFYETLRRLAPSHPGLAAVWVGAGPDALTLETHAAQDGLADRFRITGRVPHATVLDYFRAADLLVFPSHAEGLPNVVVEALAAGLPVVATDAGGTRELIRDGATGLLVPPADVAALTRAARRLLDDPERARTLARNGRRLAFEQFDAARNAQTALVLFRQAAASGKARRPST